MTLDDDVFEARFGERSVPIGLPGIPRENDYLAAYCAVLQQFDMYSWQLHEKRRDMCRKFAFAIPTPEALTAIAEWGPVVELGAGTGYWAYVLRAMGVDVAAYDRAPGTETKGNNYKFTHTWTEVIKGHPPVLRQHTDQTLLLCWPDYDSYFASNCLCAYKGRRLAYIGEGNGGCTGDDRFHQALERHWNLVRVIQIPQWPSVHDALYLYEKAAVAVTIEQFEQCDMQLARSLRAFVGNYQIDGVYRREDFRWEAHCTNAWAFERCIESRCHPSCHRARQPWHWEGHACCTQCQTDPGHYYQTVHE